MQDQTLDQVDQLWPDGSTWEQINSTDENYLHTDEIPYVGYKFAPFDGLVSFEEQKHPTSGSRYSYKFTIVCWACKQEFQSARSTTKTCSPKCRDNLKHTRRAAEKAAQQAAKQIDILRGMLYSPDPILVDRAREALRFVAVHARETSLSFGISTIRK
jgi:hypothetical protein